MHIPSVNIRCTILASFEYTCRVNIFTGIIYPGTNPTTSLPNVPFSGPFDKFFMYFLYEEGNILTCDNRANPTFVTPVTAIPIPIPYFVPYTQFDDFVCDYQNELFRRLSSDPEV